MTQEALKLALEALITASGHLNNEAFVKVMMARDAVVEALAQEQEPVATLFGSLPVYDTTTPQRTEPEPVAWQVEMFIAGEWVPMGNPQRSKTKAEALASNPSLPKEHQRLFPVYTTPPQRTWVGLTLDEIALLHANYPNPQGFALALQAKLKERNT